MKMTAFTIGQRLSLLVILVALAGCGGESSPTQGPTSRPVEPEQVTGSHSAKLELIGKDEQIRIAYTKAHNQPGPRVVELFVQTSLNLSLEASQPGSAAVKAGKEVLVQDKGNGLLRVLVFSSASVRELESGELAVLSFTRSDDHSATAEILTDRPMFAPQNAMEGLSVGDPISL